MTLHVAVKAITAASASVGPSAPVAASAPPSSTSLGSAAPAPSSFIPEGLRGLLEKRE